MTQTETLRQRIVRTAKALHDEGNTWQEAADKLDISRTTLWKYRTKDEYKRGGSKTPGKTVEKKMNRGGKLTQLESNHRTDKPGPEDTPKPPIDPPIEPPPGEPIRPTRDLMDLIDERGPELANVGVNPIGKQNFPKLGDAIENGETIELTIYEQDIPRTDSVAFNVGKPSDALDVDDIHVIQFDGSNFVDQAEFGTAVWDRLLEEGIIGDTNE